MRYVRIGLCKDGFNLLGRSTRQYSSWPVILTPNNLLSWMSMKTLYMFFTLIVPWPNMQNMNIYLQPLIEELKMLQSDGVLTYDVSTRYKFFLRASLTWTVNNFSTYSMLSRWSNQGKNACPRYMSYLKAFYLRNSRKMCWFDCHQYFCLTVIHSEGTRLIPWQGFRRRIMPHILAPALSYLRILTCMR